MKKKITIFILLLFSITNFGLSLQQHTNRHSFDENAVKDNISYLSSDVFNGRMAGTFSNELAAAYIRTQYKSNGIEPYTGNYYQTFNTIYPEKVNGYPYFKILNNKGQTIKQFTYNKDFKEDMLSFTQNHVITNKSSLLSYNNSILTISNDKHNYIFYTPENGKLLFRSSFDAKSKISMLIEVTSPVLKDMQACLTSGDTIDCFIPYTETKAKINNVIGVIKGKNSALAPIVVCAHFDHMGIDFSDNIYHGALDNASGISFVLEMSKYIKSLGKPDRDIIFAAFNAEEFGLLGSDAFAKQYSKKLVGSEVFNFDMVGSDNSVPLCIMGAKTDTKNTPLIHSLADICTSNHIKYDYLFEDASDHSSFRKLGIEAVTFCDNDMTRIHTPNDKAEFISTSAITRCYNVSSKEIVGLAYKENPWILYNNYIWVISLVCSIILGIALVLLHVKGTKN